MATLGETLKAAREKRKVTASAAAAATRMKVQHIEAMEANDFSRMAAPAYARGFIKLYAEFLELDPAPLVEEYGQQHAEAPAATLVPDPVPDAPGGGSAASARDPIDWMALFKRVPWQKIAWALGVLVLALFLLSAVSRIIRLVVSHVERDGGGKQHTPDLAVIEEPPGPYMELQSVTEGGP